MTKSCSGRRSAHFSTHNVVLCTKQTFLFFQLFCQKNQVQTKQICFQQIINYLIFLHFLSYCIIYCVLILLQQTTTIFIIYCCKCCKKIFYTTFFNFQGGGGCWDHPLDMPLNEVYVISHNPTWYKSLSAEVLWVSEPPPAMNRWFIVFPVTKNKH